MKGYQHLEMEFFELCEARKIYRTPQHLLIYLRGLYCRFQKPLFFWFDKTLRKHLGISQSTLLRSRQYLKERGEIDFISGLGSKPTQYIMLKTVLLPVIKKAIPYRHTPLGRCRQNDDTNNTSKERVKNRIGIFQGMTEKDRKVFNDFGIVINSEGVKNDVGNTIKTS